VPGVERWPPVYDAEQLKNTITELANRDDLEQVIYDSGRATEAGPCCQGDVVEFSQGVPLLDENCEPIVVDAFSYWLVIGNTCDFHRKPEDVQWTQLVPVMEWLGVPTKIHEDLRRYRPSREFYLPPWNGSRILETDHALVADFLRPCALDRAPSGAQRASSPGSRTRDGSY
jgi:hypothetical protein